MTDNLIRIPAQEYVTCDEVADHIQSPWVLLAYWLLIFGFAIGAWVLGVWLFARAL